MDYSVYIRHVEIIFGTSSPRNKLASWAEGPRRRPISPLEPRGPLVPVLFRFVPFPSFRSTSVAQQNGAVLRPVRGKVVRLPQLSDEAASYRCAYRIRAVMCIWRVRDARVSCEKSSILRIFFKIAAKREAKIADIYTGKWRCIVE